MCTRFSWSHDIVTGQNFFGADLHSHSNLYRQYPEAAELKKAGRIVEIDWPDGSSFSSLQLSGGNKNEQSIVRARLQQQFPDMAALYAYFASPEAAQLVSTFNTEDLQTALQFWPGLQKSAIRVNYANLTGKALFDAVNPNVKNMSTAEIESCLANLTGEYLFKALSTWPVSVATIEAYAYRLTGSYAQSMGNILVSSSYRNYALSAMTSQQVLEVMNGTWSRITDSDRAFALSRLDPAHLETALKNFTGIPVEVRRAAVNRLPADRQSAVLSAITA